MKGFRDYVPRALALLLIVPAGIALTGCGKQSEAAPNAVLSPATPIKPQNQSPVTSSIETQAATVSDSLTLLGTVQPGAQATLSARMPARIVEVDVQTGDNVRRGQRLVQLDGQEFQAQLRTAQAGVQAAQAQVEKALAGREAQRIKSRSDIQNAQAGLLQAESKWRQALLARDAAGEDNQADLQLAREGVRKAEVGVERARQTARGLEDLAKVGGVSRSDLEGARAQVTTAESDLETARTQVQRLQAGPDNAKRSASSPSSPYRVALAQKDADAAELGVRQAREGVSAAREAERQTLALADQDIRSAEAAREQSRSGVSSAQSALQSLQFVSPIEGVALSVGAHVGETAQPGIPLVTVVSLSNTHVEALVTARQLSRLHVGQSAQISVDTQPGKTFPAAVSEIARVAEPDGRSFRVKFRFRDSHLTLRPNQSARITVIAP